MCPTHAGASGAGECHRLCVLSLPSSGGSTVTATSAAVGSATQRWTCVAGFHRRARQWRGQCHLHSNILVHRLGQFPWALQPQCIWPTSGLHCTHVVVLTGTLLRHWRGQCHLAWPFTVGSAASVKVKGLGLPLIPWHRNRTLHHPTCIFIPRGSAAVALGIRLGRPGKSRDGAPRPRWSPTALV